MKRQVLVIAVLSGLLLGIGSRFPALWVLSLFSFLPLTWILVHTTSRKVIWGYTFLAGLVAYGLSLPALFWDALPLTWLGIDGALAPSLITTIWLISSVSYAAVFAGGMLVAHHLRTRTWKDILLIPAAYVLAEWLAQWAFSIINYGPGALLGPHFSMSAPAYQLAESIVLTQSATLGGIYALVFIQALIGVALYFAWFTEKKIIRTRITYTLIVVLLCIPVIGWLLPHQTDTADGIQVGLVTRYDKPDTNSIERQAAIFSDIYEQVITMPTTPDLIALPEDSRFIQTWLILDSLGNAPELPNYTFIDSATTMEDESSLYSQITYLNGATGSTTTMHKQYLMVFGEYMPYLYQGIGRAIGQADLIENIAKTRAYQRKDKPYPVTVRDVPITTLLCSDAMSPTLYSAQVRSGAHILFNLASHAWFHESKTLYITAKRTGIVRAVENRRWYARASNDTPSFIVDPWGRITAETVWQEETILSSTVYPREQVTFYTRFGLWILIVPTIILVYFWYHQLVRRKQKC